MDIKIVESWLREHLKTNATTKQITESLSLCGPSVDRVSHEGNEVVYSVEVTTNRVDSANVLGIAREAVAILPQFGINAKLKPLLVYNPKPKSVVKLKYVADKKLVNRLAGFVVSNIKNRKTPDYIMKRLELSGVRSKDLIVDITNYVMLETGHPMHAFDFDKIIDGTIYVTTSKKGESITSFDGKTYKLPGNDIVFKDKNGQIIDLPGIIGTKNSVVNSSSKNVLFFIDNNEEKHIRNTSMALGIRTYAAQINEKGVDPELGLLALKRAACLVKKEASATFKSPIIDLYLNKPKISRVVLSTKFIEERLGIEISTKEITSILKSLDFKVNVNKDQIEVIPPSFRAKDIKIKEDVLEEIARIYGYYKLPSNMISGTIPNNLLDKRFDFEKKVKENLVGMGGVEVYNLSLVSQSDKNSLPLSNELGKDTKYLRTNLFESMNSVYIQNKKEKDSYFIFEMASVYKKVLRSLPKEESRIAAILVNYNYRTAKGILETFLNTLHISYQEKVVEENHYYPGRHISYYSNKNFLGDFGVEENNRFIYFEFDIEMIFKLHKDFKKFVIPSKYPSQIENMTLQIPRGVYYSNIKNEISKTSKFVKSIALIDIYKNNFTLEIKYHSNKKTLTDKEVESERKKIITRLEKLSVVIK